MANVYSELLWRFQIKNTSGVMYSGAVPSGYVWVVRQITYAMLIVPYYGPFGFTIGDSHGGLVHGVWPPHAQSSKVYDHETRQVLNTGDQLTCATHDSAYWYVRISGYALKTP